MLIQNRIFTNLFAICISLSILLFGSITVLTSRGASSGERENSLILDVKNGTVPPIAPFTKTAQSLLGGQGVAFSGEPVTYTLFVRRVITNNSSLYPYNATVGVTDTLPTGLSTVGITTTHGTFGVDANNNITWSFRITTDTPYILTYVVAAPSIITAPTTIFSTAELSEISNDNAVTRTEETIVVTAELTVRPWSQHLPMIKNDPTPVPTPTPQALPEIPNHNFESTPPSDKWQQSIVNGNSSINLVVSVDENPLADTEGRHYAWLGGARNQHHQLTSSSVSIPSGYSDVRVQYRYWIYSEEARCDKDKVEVFINGALVNNVLTQSGKPHALCTEGGTSGWQLALTENLKPSLTTNSIVVSFKATLDGSLNSNFFFDVVTICSNGIGVPSGSRCSIASR